MRCLVDPGAIIELLNAVVRRELLAGRLRPDEHEELIELRRAHRTGDDRPLIAARCRLRPPDEDEDLLAALLEAIDW